MSISLAGLQNELEAVSEHCPTLMPSIVPHGFDVEDLWGLAHTEGKAEREALKHTLAAAVRQQSQASCSSCCVCETAGEVWVSSSSAEDEAHTLRFTAFSSLDFLSKAIRLTKGGFACGSCRAVLDPQRFLHFAALRLSEQHPDRLDLARQLCAHFATVNQAPEHVQANPDALLLWVQELMSRAYALQVVAGNINGWRLLSPSGEVVRQGVKGTSVALAEALLAAGRGRASSTPADKKTKGLKRSRRSLATPSKVRPSSSEDRDEGEPSTSKKAAQSTPTPQKTSGVKQQTPKQQRRQQQEQQEQQVQTPLTKHATPKKAVSSSKQGRAAQEASLSGAEGSKKSSSGRVGLQSERKALQQAPQHKEKKKQRMSL